MSHPYLAILHVRVPLGTDAQTADTLPASHLELSTRHGFTVRDVVEFYRRACSICCKYVLIADHPC